MSPPAFTARVLTTRRTRPSAVAVLWLALGLLPSVPAEVWISEFLADNEQGLRTTAGDAADWIELVNSDSHPVDVGGWYLTDRASTPTEWRIPDGTTIPAGGYLVIFADSSPVSITNGELHASFSLSRDGEYLGLIGPDGLTVADEFAPRFPPQLRDISYGRDAQSFPAYFKRPTPGAANADAFTEPTPVVTASEPRGYRTNPFTVSLACTNASAEIRYTLDGGVPGTNSVRYTGPLTVSQTTTLRAAVMDPTTVRQNVTTVTWLFLEDILQQGAAPPPGWPASRQVNNHVMEYGLRQDIVTGDPARLRSGLTNAIPSLSLVTDLANLFSAQRGIYVNPGNDGIAWERPVSVELIDPVPGPGSEFHIDAGLRIRGAYSRSSGNPKHSFRLFFRSEYGEGRLRFPLFGEEGASEFDKVDLRTSQNYSWAFENSNQETFVRETFSRDSQRDLGMPYTRSRYYHLYLNGQYWGLYQTQERGDADFAETYLGGVSDDWDCIKTSQPGYTTTASDGTFDAFYAFHNLAINQGFTGAYFNNYFRVRGLNPDGTPNPAYPAYLDKDNLIVYMLIALYTGDPDSPVSIWGAFPTTCMASSTG